jgi:hypothetical protein
MSYHFFVLHPYEVNLVIFLVLRDLRNLRGILFLLPSALNLLTHGPVILISSSVPSIPSGPQLMSVHVF